MSDLAVLRPAIQLMPSLADIVDLLGIDLLHALAWSLLHSVWHAAVLCVFLMICLKLTRSSQAALRYQILAVGLGVCLVLSVVTFFSHFQKTVLTLRLSEQGRVATYIPFQQDTTWAGQFSSLLNQHLSLIIFCWSIGFVLMCSKTLWQWSRDRQLARCCTENLPAHWVLRFSELALQLGIGRTISFRLSMQITIPCVFAYFKPVVLLPASLLLGMSPQQIDAIVLHELAHIRRHDILLANVQSAMKAVYFFNPFIFWISAKLDQERENACDDLAISVLQNPLLYAETLHHYAEMHTHFLSTATSLIGRKNMLKHRIQRLFVNESKSASKTKKCISTVLLLSMGLTTAAYAWMQIDSRHSMNLSAKNLPIKQLLQQAETACPGSTAKTQLRQPELPVTVNFSNLACTDVPAIFTDIEERFGMKFNAVQLSAALKIFQQQCPAVFRHVTLKNPDALYSANMLDVTCLQVLDAVATFDAKHHVVLAD